MELVEIDKNEFNEIAKTFDSKNFFQTSNMGTTLEKRGKEVYYLGLKEDNNFLGVTVVSSRYKFLGKTSFECLKGVLVDYQNEVVVSTFLKKLKEFVKNKNGYKLSIDPYLVYKQRDIDGNLVDGGVDNSNVVNFLKKLGFNKTKKDVQVKFNFCLDILGKSSDELFKEFNATTRNRINKAIKEGVEIHNLSFEEIKDFKKITEDTCKRRRFSDKSLEYYESMYNEFGKDVVFKIAKLNVSKHIEALNDGIKKLNEQLESEKVGARRKEEAKIELETLNKRLEKINSIAKDKGFIDLAGAMFILYGDETVYLFSGGYDELKEYSGQYLLQWDIIKYAAEHNYKRHNFFGIFGFKDKSEKDYGIYSFKRGFNGYVEELFGEYECFLDNKLKIVEKIKEIIRK